jgi:moderate conductance mechanosensitive channel
MYMEDVVQFLSVILDNPLVQVSLTLATAIIIQLIFRASIERVVHRAMRIHKYASDLDEKKRAQTLITIFRTASAVVIWITAIIVILWQLDVNITALLTGAGVLGIIVGFGAQTAIRDFLAGIFIITENQYRVGDIVTLHATGKDITGVVEDITIRITRLRDLDGNLHTVQNGEANVVTNLSFGYANVNIDIRIAYETDVDVIETIINTVGEEMQADKTWAPHIFEPIQFLRIDGFEDSAVRVKALGKVEPAMQWDIAGEFRRRLKKAFEKNHITIPYPQVINRTPQNHHK